MVPIQYSLGTMFASTRTSPSRSMSVQKACGDLPFFSYRSLALMTVPMGRPMPS
ncbi:MAG: hypothetical protein ABGY75_05890 [Gemmataceae bacterium]